MKRHNIISLFLSVMILLVASSCSSEIHYANKLLRDHKHNRNSAVEQIYVCLPSHVLHTNTSLNTVPYFDQMSYTEQNSVIDSLTRILNKLNDSIYLSQFSQSLLYTISRTCIPVTVVFHESLLPKATEHIFVLNVVQLEAEEFVERSRADFRTRKGYYFHHDYDLRHFSTNAWFEFDSPGRDTNLYFYNQEIVEDFQGTVTSLKGDKSDLNAVYQRISVNDAYFTASQLGYECGRFFVERCLHTYIKSIKGTNEWYLFYEPNSNSISGAVDYPHMKDYGFINVNKPSK